MKLSWWRFVAREIRVMLLTAMAAAAWSNLGRAQDYDQWKEPSASLAAEIANTIGPGPVALTVRNLSGIPADQLPGIRKMLEADLKSHGVTSGGSDSASNVRITLSESAHERLWVAEISQGSDVKVAMVELGQSKPAEAKATGVLTLRRQSLIVTEEPVLAVLDTSGGLLVLQTGQVVLYRKTESGWREQRHASLGLLSPLGRDPRGLLFTASGESDIEAWLPGVRCTTGIPSDLTTLDVRCRESDDPWPLAEPMDGFVPPGTASDAVDGSGTPIRAFYNPARNFFTGVLVPSAGPALAPFYDLALFLRRSRPGVLIEGVDGHVQLMENGTLHSVSGTRDWGSDFAVLQSGCGSGSQAIVSGSGDAASDSLRAYELPAFEAIPAGESLDVDGSVTALSSAADGKSVLAIVRRDDNTYEVDRVTALCN